MKKEIKFNVFYGTEDFTKLFNNLIEEKIKNVTDSIKNTRCNKSDKNYPSIQKKVDINE